MTPRWLRWSAGPLIATLWPAPAPVPPAANTGAQGTDSIVAACESAQRLLGGLGLATRLEREAEVINEFAGAPYTPRPGCRVSGGTDRDSVAAPVEELVAAFEREGWEAPLSFQADGPNGALVGLRRGSTMCLLRGEWDGGDDSDSTYVPKPGYALEVVCYRATAAERSRQPS